MSQLPPPPPASPSPAPGQLPGAGPAPRTSALAVWSLVLAILGLCSVLPAIPALLLGIIALTQIRPGSGLQGRGLATSGVIISSLTLLLLPILAAIALPAFASVKQKAQEVQSMTNVNQLHLLIQAHYMAQGSYPRDWDALFSTTGSGGDIDKSLLTSPFGPEPYRLLLQEGQAPTEDTPLILDPNKCRRGYVVGFAGGVVKVVPPEELQLPANAPP